MIWVGGHLIQPTIFPDGTSQVWKLPTAVRNSSKILWNFEHEAELFHVISLSWLMQPGVEVFAPYLPYARQDKVALNESTFSLAVFASIVKQSGIAKVSCVDVHNETASHALFSGIAFESKSVEKIHRQVIDGAYPDTIVFPDEGAKARYPHLHSLNHCTFKKVRNQLTGEITYGGLIEGKPFGTCLIVDDICDGGGTFVACANALRGILGEPNKHLYLFVTHGIFSKGIDFLKSNGISVMTTDTIINNRTRPGVYTYEIPADFI